MNLVRITATAYVYCTLGAVAAHTFFHDLAGWLMMPLAFAALWLELALLGRLFVAVPIAVGPVPLTLPRNSTKIAPRTVRCATAVPAVRTVQGRNTAETAVAHPMNPIH
jgi:hypothetical protein